MSSLESEPEELGSITRPRSSSTGLCLAERLPRLDFAGGSTKRNTKVQRAVVGSAKSPKSISLRRWPMHSSTRESPSVDASRRTRCTLPSTSSCQEKRAAPRRLGLAKKQRRSSVSLPRSRCTTSLAASSTRFAFESGVVSVSLAAALSSDGTEGGGEEPPHATKPSTRAEAQTAVWLAIRTEIMTELARCIASLRADRLAVRHDFATSFAGNL